MSLSVRNCESMCDCLCCVSEAETRQRLLRTVKKEVGVFSSAVIVKQTRWFVWSCVVYCVHRKPFQPIHTCLLCCVCTLLNVLSSHDDT